MRIVHLSYARISDYKDPDRWLQRINFFTGIPEAMAKEHVVHSVHCIGYVGGLKRNSVNYHFVPWRKWSLLFPISLNNYVKGLTPDAVIVHGLHFSWPIFLLRMQLGKTVRIFAQHHAERPLRFFKRFFQKLNDQFISGYFFSSLALARPWVDQGLIQDPSKITEVMEASSVFYPIEKAEARKQTGVNHSPVYLWVGRFDRNKDPLTLVEAFVKFLKHVSDAQLYIVFQQDDLLKDVENIIKGHSTNIILLGKVPHSELLQWYNSTDFIISTSHYEGSGIAVCESMSCGGIPILTDIPSFKMMTANGALGLLFTPGDSDSLVNALMTSRNLNIDDNRQKVLDFFQARLSFKAIAEKMLETINNNQS
jgi:glycosyltransferase involved in cell wall biosynthesis